MTATDALAQLENYRDELVSKIEEGEQAKQSLIGVELSIARLMPRRAGERGAASPKQRGGSRRKLNKPERPAKRSTRRKAAVREAAPAGDERHAPRKKHGRMQTRGVEIFKPADFAASKAKCEELRAAGYVRAKQGQRLEPGMFDIFDSAGELSIRWKPFVDPDTGDDGDDEAED